MFHAEDPKSPRIDGPMKMAWLKPMLGPVRTLGLGSWLTTVRAD
jgi:hypothetical protein